MQHRVIAAPLRWLEKLEAARPFSEAEAWGLFRLAAFAEAFGWTVLIIGVAINRYGWPLHQYSVPIAGRVHGTIFIGYFVTLLIAYSSLRWRRTTFLAAVCAGVPPYGSLVFEQWAAHHRKTLQARRYYRSLLLVNLTSNN